jgi:hypothetical protein
MTLKAIDVIPSCEHHGDGVEVVTIGGVRYCGTCVAKLFEEHDVGVVKMVRIEMETTVEGDGVETCTCCGALRRPPEACPICGYQEGQP